MNRVAAFFGDDLNEETVFTWRGAHRDIHYEIICMNVGRSSTLGLKAQWATYVLLTEEMHERFKDKIGSAPWNHGQTYYRKHSVEHIDVPEELKARWDSHYYKIGDDFSHFWDMEGHAGDMPLSYFESHIEGVIDYLVGEEK